MFSKDELEKFKKETFMIEKGETLKNISKESRKKIVYERRKIIYNEENMYKIEFFSTKKPLFLNTDFEIILDDYFYDLLKTNNIKTIFFDKIIKEDTRYTLITIPSPFIIENLIDSDSKNSPMLMGILLSELVKRSNKYQKNNPIESENSILLFIAKIKKLNKLYYKQIFVKQIIQILYMTEVKNTHFHLEKYNLHFNTDFKLIDNFEIDNFDFVILETSNISFLDLFCLGFFLNSNYYE